MYRPSADISNVTVEEIDSFFRVIQPVSSGSVSTSSRHSVASYNISSVKREIPKAKSRGQIIHHTGERVEIPVEDDNYLPRYLRQKNEEYDDSYAKIYQDEENQRLLQDVNSSSTHSDDISIVAGRLHDIDIDSVYSETSYGMPDHLIPEKGTEVYERYNFEHEYNERLPITQHQQEIVRTVETNPVTVIQGTTGSGKTTQVPQYILDYHVDMGQYCNIVVTQPRRIAARSIATRVCHERDWDCGTVCGYQVGLDDPKRSEDTRLMYVTTGVLLQKLIVAKNMDEFTHVIIDEVHERDQDTDFLLVVVRKMLRAKSRHVKVILMSATMDCDLFINYFLVPVGNKLEPAPLLRIDGRMFQVSEFYLENLRTLGSIPKIDLDTPSISEESFNLAYNLILQFDNLEIKEQGQGDSGFAENRGSVLVFLPGLFNIENMHQRLNDVNVKHKLNLIPLHSSISIIDQAKVFDPPVNNFRKVILSTNIAESSITVPDIKYVIDFCLTKNLVADENTSYTSLQMQWCSKSSSNQRKGRAGRVDKGRVYRMVTKRFWNDHLPEYGVPEMQRCPLPHVVLNVKRLDLGEPKAILALCISPPNLNDIEKTILMLRVIGALRTSSTDSPHDGELTFLGRAMSQFPLDVRLGKLLVIGFVFGVLKECLVISAAHSLKSVFTKPFMKELEAYKNKLMWSEKNFCDSLAVLEVYNTWQRHHTTGYFKRSGNSENAWCYKNSLQLRRLREVQRLIEDLTTRLKRLNIHVPMAGAGPLPANTDPSDHRLILKIALCGAFYPNYFIQQPLDEDNINRMLSGHDPSRTVVILGLPSNQGILYKDAIEEQFRDCDKRPPIIHFEESKAYVEFAADFSHTTGKVHPGVYAAIKKRLLKKFIEIQPFSSEEGNKRLKKIEALAAQETQKSGRLRTHRLTATGPQETLHVPNGIIRVYVTEVITCGHFWVQIAIDQNYYDLKEIQQGLNENTLQPLSRPIKSGLLVVAPFHDGQSSQYYRAQVHDVPQGDTSHLRRVQVFYVDYGNRASVGVQELRHLNEELQLKPFQAVECFLSEIRPSVVNCPNGEWSQQATRVFSQMVLSPSLYGEIYSCVGSTLRLSLHEPTPTQGTVKINDELVNRGFAEKCTEPIVSRQNHEKRKMEAGLSGAQTVVSSNFLPVSVDNMATGGKRRDRKITLRGPQSPVEMSFVNLSSAGRYRAVRIEQGSVNQVAIDDDPNNTIARLMVASFVGLSATTDHMIAHGTTILPHIPGLPAIVSLLFCPTAELRVDPKRTHYTGAICGLGAEEGSKAPIFSDDDMEITFDTKISLTDISKINGVRMAINIAIGIEETSISWGQEAIVRIQDSARSSLLDLIKKARPPVEMYYYTRPYRWNMVAAEDVIPYSMTLDPNQLYQLHNCVALTVPEDPDSDTESVDAESSVMSL